MVIDSSDKSKPKLLDHYNIVPAVDLGSPATGEGKARPTLDQIAGAEVKNQAWLDHVHEMMENKGAVDDDLLVV